jgi:TrmH family RNA methyltransferase
VVTPAGPIRSSSNPLLKRVRAAAAGRGDGEILLEGDRLVDDARRAGLALSVVLVAEERAARLAELANAGLPVRAVAGALLARASALESPPGCLALAPTPPRRTLAALPERTDALLVVAAGVQDPGNLGALARTAEAAGAAGVLVVRGGCRPWNPKALRGSMGSLLRLPVIELEPAEEEVRALERSGFRCVCARTRGGTPFDRFDWSGRIALWLSGEGGGLPGGRARQLFEGVSIPMSGAVESLNVTAAGAVLLYAARRAGATR